MSTLQQQAEELRARARRLRTNAGTLDGAGVHILWMRSGSDTWLGPKADAFRIAARRAAEHVEGAVARLHGAAGELDRRAAQLDAAAAAARAASPAGATGGRR